MAVFLDNAFAEGRPQWGVLAYLSGQGGLEREAAAYWQAALKAADAGCCVAGVQVDGPHVCARWLAAPGTRPGWQPRGMVNMGAEATLTEFLVWAYRHVVADRYLLIVMGHGTGLATLAPAQSGVAYDGGAGDTLTIAELSGALSGVRCRGGRLELVSLEACYAASVEVAYALRQTADYLVASPGRVASPGLPWSQVLPELEHCGDGQAVIAALDAAHSSALAGVELRRVGEVAEILSALAAEAQSDLETNAPALRLVRSRTPNWGYRDEMCDLLYLADALGEMAATTEVARQAGRLAEALEHAILPPAGRQRANASAGDSGRIGKLGVFFPATWEPVPVSYRSSYRLADETGWADLLQACYELSRRRLIGVQDPFLVGDVAGLPGVRAVGRSIWPSTE